MMGKTGKDTPYSKVAQNAFLQYDICKAKDIATLWKAMAKKYIPKPTKIVSPDVLSRPIWTTWAKYKGKINQDKVMKFAKDITGYGTGYQISQLEIDDRWTSTYGDLDFDKTKFPNATLMISNLTSMGIPVTVWIHPFFNNDSNSYQSYSNISGLIKSDTSASPALTSWWRAKDKTAGVLDVTNTKAVDKFLAGLRQLKTQHNITSFKFDAGETNWLPKTYKMQDDLANPSDYTTKYVEMARRADDSMRQEVRAGYKSQASSMMVRMLDRASNWGRNRGLKTLIPTALTFGMMGYPFVLPDLIGGNAMDVSDSGSVTTMDGVNLPDKELYIRWLQATALLPMMQFSIGPWDYKEDPLIARLTKKFIDLHEKYAPTIIKLGQEAVAEGNPIIRPLWWTDPEDEVTLTCDDQFLLGNDILVAPVLEQGMTSRDVYIPSGQWTDMLTKKSVSGPKWLRNYAVGLEDLAYFTRQ